jgi:hypothetical protein
MLLLLWQQCCHILLSSWQPLAYSKCHKLSNRACKNTFQIRILQLYIELTVKITCTEHTRSDYGRLCITSIATSPSLLSSSPLSSLRLDSSEKLAAPKSVIMGSTSSCFLSVLHFLPLFPPHIGHSFSIVFICTVKRFVYQLVHYFCLKLSSVHSNMIFNSCTNSLSWVHT